MLIYQIFIAVVVFGLLVFVHELGHFLVAKFFKIGVLEFAIGFGKRLCSFKYGDTTYSIRAIPLGGFVRMVGEHPLLLNEEEQSKSDREEIYAQMSEEERRLHENKACWFLKQAYLPKVAVVFAGPLFNIIFAIFLAVTSVLYYGKPVLFDKPVIGDLLKGFPAEKAGLKPLDKIVNIDGTTPNSWDDLVKLIMASQGREMTITVERPQFEDGNPGYVDNVAVRTLKEASSFETLNFTFSGSYETNELDTLLATADKPIIKRPRIGAGAYTERTSATLSEAFEIGIYHVKTITELNIKGMFRMFTGDISPKNIGGPILIAKEAASSARKGMDSVIDFMILLSMSLAILNLLPVPVLDGGHITIFTIEKILGGPIKLRAQEVATQIGMALLLALMLFAFSNDLLRLFGVYKS